MDAPIEGFSHFRIDQPTESGEATEGSLHMPAGATEPVVKVEVSEGRVEVIKPHQADHSAAEPDAFRVSCRSVDRLRSFHEFVGFALAVLVGIRGRRLLRRLVLRAGIAALGDGAADPDQKDKARRGGALKECRTKSVKNATHEVPN
jgi:hypothetical protein